MARKRRTITRHESKDDDSRRFLRFRLDRTGRNMRLAGRLPVADGEQLREVLDGMIGQPGANGPERFPWDTRAADALCDLAHQHLSDRSDAASSTLVVHVDASTLAGTAGNGCTQNGGVLGAATLERLACDCRWLVHVDGRDGPPLGIGRASRQIPRWLRRAVHVRDVTCRFPGCHQTHRLTIHHIVAWAQGGPTDLVNLIALCRRHHRLVHDGGWQILGSAGDLRFQRPAGEALPEHPPPACSDVRDRVTRFILRWIPPPGPSTAVLETG